MSRMTWSKFFWDDVLKDHNLQRCTYTARGFWLHLKALSVQVEPMGYLADGDVPMTTSDIARLSRLDRRSVERLLRELEAAGVFSRDARGTIYCRRIVRENAARLRNKINGSAGGNPQLTAKSSEAPDNPYKLKAKELSASEPPPGNTAPSASRVAPLIRAAEAMDTTLDALHRHHAWMVFGDTFLTWLDEGCDPERDIWPTLRARTLKRRGKVPASPAYFTDAVRDARDRRLAGRRSAASTLGAPYLASTAHTAKPWVSPDEWADRLEVLKTHGLWSRHWGPRPGEAGSLVPGAQDRPQGSEGQRTEHRIQGSESANP